MECAPALFELKTAAPAGPVTIPAPSGPIPDFDWYDHLVVSTSAGKDSLSAQAVVAALAEAAGVAHKVVAVHADLKEMEWPGTLELAREHADLFGHRFEVVRRVTRDGTEQDLLEHIEQRGMFPGKGTQYCTSDMKRGPIQRLYTQLAKETRAAGITDRPARILSVMGLRAQESPDRKNKPVFWHDGSETCPCAPCQARPSGDRGRGQSNTRKQVDFWLPLHGWTTPQVFAQCAATSATMHPAYGLGFPRASCIFCIFASKAALVRACQLFPELAARYAAIERRTGHTLRHGFSIIEAIELAKTTPVPDTIPTWAY